MMSGPGEMRATQGREIEELRLHDGTGWTGDLGSLIETLSAEHRPVAIDAQGTCLPAGGAKDLRVVVAVSVEDVFPELGWVSECSVDVAALSRLVDESQGRIDAYARQVHDSVELARHYVLIPPVLNAVRLPVSERRMALRISRLGARITDALADALADLSAGSIVDVEQALGAVPRNSWRADDGPRGMSPTLSGEAAEILARDVLERLWLQWQPKVIVTDLDWTLWRGTLSEDGPEQVGARARPGELEFRAWQRLLLCARAQGFILAISSKNSSGSFDVFSDAALRSRTGMLVAPRHFAAISTAWEPKSAQIRTMAKLLDLPASSFVLVDDNPTELAEVAAAGLGVRTIRFPGSGDGWFSFASQLSAITAVSDGLLTEEDQARAEYYGLRYRVETELAGAGSVADVLAALGMRLELTRVGAGAASSRCLQLLNRANRFHLTGHRFEERDWAQLTSRPGVEAFTARLTDRYGDHGVCLVLVTETDGDVTWIREFAMSCRILNRSVDTAVFAWVADRSGAEVRTIWHPTGRNGDVLDGLHADGFTAVRRPREQGEPDSGGSVELGLDVTAESRPRRCFVDVHANF